MKIIVTVTFCYELHIDHSGMYIDVEFVIATVYYVVTSYLLLNNIDSCKKKKHVKETKICMFMYIHF